MKPRQFILWCRYADDTESAWSEPYHVRCEDPEAWASELIDQFNADCREGERRRVFLAVEEMPVDRQLKHDWSKVNLFTLGDRSGAYDRYRCDDCGIYARRYGIGGEFVPELKAARYVGCPGPKKLWRKVRKMK